MARISKYSAPPDPEIAEKFWNLFLPARRRLLLFIGNYLRKKRYFNPLYEPEDYLMLAAQRAVRRFQTFTGKSTFSTWMCSVAMNEIKMIMRVKGLEKRALPVRPDDPDPLEILVSQEESPLESAIE